MGEPLVTGTQQSNMEMIRAEHDALGPAASTTCRENDPNRC